MLSFDVLDVIMVVNSIEPANFVLFRLDNAPPKWVCCCWTQNSAKSTGAAIGMLVSTESLFCVDCAFLGPIMWRSM